MIWNNNNTNIKYFVLFENVFKKRMIGTKCSITTSTNYADQLATILIYISSQLLKYNNQYKLLQYFDSKKISKEEYIFCK